MDVWKMKQGSKPPSPPPLTAEKKNVAATATSRRTRTREASSRHRRCSSPAVTKPATSSNSVSNRAISTERRRSSPPLSTPRKDTVAEYHYNKGIITSNKLLVAESSLWPSTMRNLNVSFQSHKNEKPVNQHGIMRDRDLRPLCNEIMKKKPIETPDSPRKRTPLNLSENSRPVDVDVHSQTGGKVLSIATKRCTNFSDKSSRSLSLLQPRNGVCSLRRLSLDNMCNKPLQKSGENTSFDDNSLVLDRTLMSERAKKLDPNKVLVSSSFGSRGIISPLRSRTSSHVPLIGPSFSRSRQTNPTTVLSYIADIKKGKKGSSHVEDVHQLRMLYNRHLQWRYANDQANVSKNLQIEKAERTLFNARSDTSEMWHSVIEKRMKLQKIKLHSKLCSIINSQMLYLDVWDTMEMDHTESLIRVIRDLQSCTLRLPVTGGAKGDSGRVKPAVCSALSVLQAMGSSIGVLPSQMEKMYWLVSEVSNVAAKERAMLDECEALLGSTLQMQVEEDSLRIKLMQLKEA